ncbi:MAG TPA: two-component regulator propeller domain-containing protein [Verrucomicrobiae bacterium]|nr:two-component regulator propeller domain-containing protein [Verrucomicrobiae bacterium]
MSRLGLLALLLLGAASARAGRYHIDTWQTDKGLPHSSVTAVVQASDGYLWVATQNGLARFDGVRFRVLDENNTPAMKNSRLVQLFEDRTHALWIGAEQGELIRQKDGVFTSYTLPGKGTTHNYVRTFCEDSNSLWLVSCEWQLIHLEHEQFTVPSASWNLSGRHATAVTADARGQIWVGTERELAVLQGGQFVTVWSQTNEPNFQVEFLAPSRDGGCWVAGNGRLRKFSSPQREQNLAGFDWNNRPVYDLYEDRQRRLWIATLGSGLFRYDPDGAVLHLTTREGLPSDFVRCVTEDKEGDIWIGAEGGGLCRLKPALFETFDTAQGLASSQAMSVSEGTNGMWVGSNGDGLDYLTEGGVRHFGPESGLKNGHVWAVVQDPRHVLWAGTWDGLYKNDGTKFIGLSDGATVGWQVLALYEDHHGDMWVGQQAFNGVTRLHNDERTVFRVPGASPSFDVRAMAEDRNGAFWIGTAEEGLFRMQGSNFTRFGKSAGLRSEAIWCLHTDHEGNLWVGTCRGGLSLWREGRFVTWTAQEGLVNNVICQILEDDDGNLWLGSYGGIARVRKEDLRRSAASGAPKIQCQRYGMEDGLPSLECDGGFQPSGCRSHDGRLWFPTVKGLAVIDPRHVSKNPLPPPVLTEETLIDGVAAAPPAPGRQTVVKAGSQRVEFHFTALSFAAPDEVRFRYRLEGLENNWVEAGGQRSASYSHIPPGAYVFHVMACNNDGVWNETGASLPLLALPHYWQTGWFFAITALLVVGGAASAARYAEGRKMQRRVELAERGRAVEQERTRIAKDMHDSLGANLTEIAMLSELAQSPEARPEQVTDDIRRITTRARELTRSLDEIVWAVNPQNDTLENFVAYTCTFAEDYLRLARIACRLDVPERLPEISFATDLRHNLFLAIKEAVNNIVKHSAASEVWIKVKIAPPLFAVTIEDNGRGFSPPAASGRNGLVNMRKRMETIGGRFQLRSEPGLGSRLSLEIDLRN